MSPLKKGRGKKSVSENVAELMRSGRSREQSVAIAMKQAGRSKKNRKKGYRKK